ncbi:MAG: lytic transglycosylase domain-containing protein [Geminicoccaceae bacterium]|nr:MAG: lytic transglycosylase domain-containing protein [Geminicoccaceae bacterium]
MRHAAWAAMVVGVALAVAAGDLAADDQPTASQRVTGDRVVTTAAVERSMDLCLQAIADEERRHDWLPPGLLTSIALVESAYRPAGQNRTVPWPWTINSPHGAFYLPSRGAAVAQVEALQRAGVRNIDVGCMQVNLMHHPRAFRSLHDAFEPRHNVRYATAFLQSLYAANGSLFQAVGRYHSSTPTLRDAYAQRVFARWGKAPEVTTVRSRHGLGEPASPRLVESLLERPAATMTATTGGFGGRHGTARGLDDRGAQPTRATGLSGSSLTNPNWAAPPR